MTQKKKNNDSKDGKILGKIINKFGENSSISPKGSEQSVVVVGRGLTSGFQICPGLTLMFVFCCTSWLITFTWHTRCKSLPDRSAPLPTKPWSHRMENHRVLRLWLCCGGGSNWITVPMVLAQLHCFNHDMSMLLPGKLWIQF